MNDAVKKISDLLSIELSDDCAGNIEVGMYDILFFLATEIKRECDLGNPRCEQTKKEFTEGFNEIQRLKDQAWQEVFILREVVGDLFDDDIERSNRNS